MRETRCLEREGTSLWGIIGMGSPESPQASFDTFRGKWKLHPDCVQLFTQCELWAY